MKISNLGFNQLWLFLAVLVIRQFRFFFQIHIDWNQSDLCDKNVILVHIKTIPLKWCWYFYWQRALQKIFFSSAPTASLLLLACYLSEFYWHLLNLIKGTKLDSYFERRKWKNIQLLFGCRETYTIQQDIFRIISSVVSTFNMFNFKLIFIRPGKLSTKF